MTLSRLLDTDAAFILAGVWLYQSCWLQNYRAGKPTAVIKDQIDLARWRANMIYAQASFNQRQAVASEMPDEKHASLIVGYDRRAGRKAACLSVKPSI